MTKSVAAMTARKNFGEILESVYYRNDEVIIERAGKPMGVLIPMALYHKLERRRAEALAKIEQLWTDMPQTVDVANAERDILTEAQAVRHGQPERRDH